MKIEAKTISAFTGLVAVLLGGIELRMAVNRMDDKLSRVEERVSRIERDVSPNPVAVYKE